MAARKPKLEKIEVRNRWTGEVQFTAEIEATPEMTPRFKLGLAVRWGYKSGADLRGCPVKIPDIHKAIFDAASQPGALDMGAWHCGTAHCRAGWAVALAGEGGKALEWAMGTPAAAAMIYMASDPALEKIPNFYDTNEGALADMARLAEQAAA